MRIACDSLFGTTTTMGAHQSVGSVIWQMTLSFTSRSSSSLTFVINGRGTRRGVQTACGTASSTSLIEYCCGISPKPQNSLGYFECSTPLMKTMTPRAVLLSLLSSGRDVCMTYSCVVAHLLLRLSSHVI